MIEVILISGKKETMENMILARIQKDREGKDLMKVCSFTKMSALKREYAVKSSSTSRNMTLLSTVVRVALAWIS